jgi:hypothetical protein
MKAITAVKDAVTTVHLDSLVGMEKLPHLRAFLTDGFAETKDAKVARLPGAFYVQPRDGELSVTLKEPSSRLMMRISVPDVGALLVGMEAALASPLSMWEQDLWAKEPRPMKKPRG